MTTMPLRVTGGVDTHLDVHVAAALDHRGGLLGVESFEGASDMSGVWACSGGPPGAAQGLGESVVSTPSSLRSPRGDQRYARVRAARLAPAAAASTDPWDDFLAGLTDQGRSLRGCRVRRVSADGLGHRLQDLAGFGPGGVVGVHIDPSDDAVRVGDDDGGHGQSSGPVRVDLGQVQAQL